MASDTITLAIDPDDSEEACPPELIKQLHNDARDVAELWHKLGNIPGAFEPISDYV